MYHRRRRRRLGRGAKLSSGPQNHLWPFQQVAHPNACNPEGLTALHSVARTQNVDCALLLLEFGADLNAVSSTGKTPLATAIIHNNHPVIKLFVDRCYDYMTTLRFESPQILPIIAEHADVETISTLASSHPLKLSLDLSMDSLIKSRAILEQRQDYTEKLSAAFEEPVMISQAQESMADSMSSLQESGLFYSARSSFHSDLAKAVTRLNSTNVSSSAGSEGEMPDTREGVVEDPQPEGEPPLDEATDRIQW
ncbi:hypothetical protein IQ07DRAFT_585764 [Pyrenochaeta sp. DS3sAY3a]|nr:hypothetical protein IQ07DRAFT_585764 [Pyrenochaeta sp. DS3sAY3a]